MNEPRQEATKKRREYIWKRGTVYSIAGVYGLVSVVGFIVTAIAVILGPAIPPPWIVGGLILGIGGYFGNRAASDKAKAIPYVPPVAEQLEQLAALPAEAILVRGSDQPAVAPGELLRAAKAGETKDEAGDLVRAGTK